MRHVWRELNDGNGDHKVLALQVWVPADHQSHDLIAANGGYWEDVPVSLTDNWLDPNPEAS